jgi:hypothetical protein
MLMISMHQLTLFVFYSAIFLSALSLRVVFGCRLKRGTSEQSADEATPCCRSWRVRWNGCIILLPNLQIQQLNQVIFYLEFPRDHLNWASKSARTPSSFDSRRWLRGLVLKVVVSLAWKSYPPLIANGGLKLYQHGYDWGCELLVVGSNMSGPLRGLLPLFSAPARPSWAIEQKEGLANKAITGKIFFLIRGLGLI